MIFRKKRPASVPDSVEVSIQVEATVDGKHVPNLAMWIGQVRDTCAAGRNRLYPAEQFAGYIEDAAHWYRGEHWENAVEEGVLTASDNDMRVENRIAEKVDVIASMLVQNRPTITTLPRTGGDVNKAAQLNQILDAKLRNVGFPRFLMLTGKNAGIYGSAVCRCDHFFHRGEPDGIDVFQVLDPLAVGWEAYAKSLLESKAIVLVELWDTSDAEAHFSILTGEKVEGLPTGGEKWSKLRDWDSSVMLSATGTATESSPPVGFMGKTVITWLWYQDSERVEVPITQVVTGNDELTGEPYEREEPVVDPKTGKAQVRTKPVYPWGRLFVMAGDSRIVFDGQNPFNHGQIPLAVVDFSPEVGSVFAQPFVKSILYQQQLINESISQISTHAQFCGNPAIEVDDSVLAKPDDFTNEPGKVIHKVRSGTGRAVLPVEYGPVNPSVLQNYQIASAAVERISAISNVSGGQARASDSGIKVAHLDEISERKLEPVLQSMEEMIRRLGYQFLWNINQFTSKYEKARYINDLNEVNFVPLGDILDDPEDLKYDIIVETLQGGLTPRQREFLETSGYAQQGMVQPSLPLNWSDVPGMAAGAQPNAGTGGLGRPPTTPNIPTQP